MRLWIGVALAAALAVLAIGCGVVQNSIREFPADLLMDADLGGAESRSEFFELRRAGRYEIRAHLERRPRSAGTQRERAIVPLAGTARIRDANGGLLVERAFDISLRQGWVGVDVGTFTRSEVGRGRLTLVVSIDPEPLLLEEYSRPRVSAGNRTCLIFD